MKLEWSAMALADLDRFAAFLHDRDPWLAMIVAGEIIQRAEVLQGHPELGMPIEGSKEYREVVVQVLNTLSPLLPHGASLGTSSGIDCIGS